MSRRNPQELDGSEDQAVESQGHLSDEEIPPHSEDEGEDLIQDAERDYEAIDELDRYENEGADSEDFQLNPEARKKAQYELNKRERMDKEAHLDDYFFEDDDDDEAELRRRRDYYYKDDEDEDIDERRFIDPEECRGNLHEWIEQEDTKKYIRRSFERFLRNYIVQIENQYANKQNRGGQKQTMQMQEQIQNQKLNQLQKEPKALTRKVRVYYSKMQQMLHQNLMSIDISYRHLKQAIPTLAMWLGLEPAHLIPELNNSLYGTLCKISPQFKNIVKETYVKFYEVPIVDRIPTLKVQHLTKLIKVKGVVTVRTEVFSQLKKAMFKCFRCGEPKGPYFLHERQTINHGSCRSCHSNGPFNIERLKSIYRNFQKLTIQESPSQVMPGRIPRTKEVLLVGDNVDITKPGEQIEVIGIYSSRYQLNINCKQGFPVFHTFIQANSIKRINDAFMFSNIQENQFQKISQRPDLAELIYNSIAPTIYGHYEVKQALAFALFGGNQKINIEKAHRIRGDINVLLMGDPGTAKSQFLKSLQKIAPRSVYATGKGASAVGLTATVKQDIQTGEWRLQAGAMVLADRGLCLIDEFDKMNEHDRTSIHEAMEQQTISISKAGIVAQLRARCSVIAAANPIQGQYNERNNFADNVNLSDPILSRFDIIKVIRDKPDSQLDYNLSSFVINSHMSNHPYLKDFSVELDTLTGREKVREVMDQEFLKQYIRYAKERVKRPALSQRCSFMIKDFYKNLRNKSVTSGGISITSRHLQSTIRICQAHAKMHLRQETIQWDAEIAIRAMLRSFIETQKHASAVKIEKETRMYLE